jgi:glycosyltransferase involved in cell wall biosynthesis
VSSSICLVSPGHVASNPRLVKEAEALSAAGFNVRVVAADYLSAIRPLDDEVLRGARWEVCKVSLGTGWSRRSRALRRKLCSWLVDRGLVLAPRIALWAESDMIGALCAAAAQLPAEMYIGHYLPGLAAAAFAARRHGAKLGFDAEDSHVDELPDEPRFQGRRAARSSVERSYLSRCQQVTAASPLIAETLRRRYGVDPLVLLNVFPLSEAPETPQQTRYQRNEGPPTLYWFSQTIGPGRGLEPVMDALARMRCPAHLHLRGLVARGYHEVLQQLSSRLGLEGRIHLEDPAPPNQMARISASHDLGLALEQNQPTNRAICLTNKIFTYLLGGTPVVLSRTPAQERLAPELGAAGLLIDLEDSGHLARILDCYLEDQDGQRSARSHACQLSRARYNWDVEKRTFLAGVRRTLDVAAD